MRALPSLTASVLACAAIAACSDRTPTSAASSTSSSSSTSPPLAYEGARGSAPPSVLTTPLPPVGGFTSQVLARGGFLDDIVMTFRIKLDRATTVVHVPDPSDVIMARITIQPNSALPWHTHPGPAIATVASGQLTIVDSGGCEVRRYGAGTAFMDEGRGHVHTAFNGSDVETVIYVTYLDVPSGQGPLVPAANPGC